MPISAEALGQRIVELRERRGWNQNRLAKEAGISQPTLSAIENAESRFDLLKFGTLKNIARALGVAVDALVTPGPLSAANVEPHRQPASSLPLISWVSAGTRAEAFDPYAPGAYEALIDFDSVASKSAFCLRVRGDSMVRPNGTGFPDGCFIAVEPRRRAKSGDFVVVRFNDSDEATFKQFFIEGALKYLRPLNPTYLPSVIPPDASIVGVVFEKQIIEKF